MPVSTDPRLLELTADVAKAETVWRNAAARRLEYIAHLIDTGKVRTGYELGCALGLPWQQRAGRAYRLFRDAKALISARNTTTEPTIAAGAQAKSDTEPVTYTLAADQDTATITIDDCSPIAGYDETVGIWTVNDSSDRTVRNITITRGI